MLIVCFQLKQNKLNFHSDISFVLFKNNLNIFVIADDHVVLVNYYDKKHIFKSPLAIIKVLLHDFSCPTSA